MTNILLNLIKIFPPEIAHSITLRLLKLKINTTTQTDHPILKQHFLGLDFSNPIGLAAGFDKNAEVINQILNLGFGFTEIGTVTPSPQEGNLKPRIFRLSEDEAIINHLGFNNKGSEKVLKKLKKINVSNLNYGIVGINIGKNKNSEDAISDYCYCLEKLGPFGHYVTINISSPNTPGLRDLQLRGKIENLVKKLQNIQEKLNSIKSKPIFLKISPDLNDEQLRDIALMSLANNVSGLIISNSTVERPTNLNSSHRTEIGGLTGKPLFLHSTLALKKMYTLTNANIPLIGVGGISNGKECYEKIKSGANLVQLYTALTFQGPKIISKIKKELVDLIKTDGFNNVKEVVGKEV